MSRYRFIHEEKAVFPVVMVCPGAGDRPVRLLRLGAARGLGPRPSRRGTGDLDRAAHARSRRTYGAPRIHAELRAQGTRCARKRVARLMRAAGLVGCHRRRRTRTTVADPAHAPAPNLVAPDRLWLGDITYVATHEGWLYLAVLLDPHSRRVLGWAMADHRRSELAADALAMALRARQPPPGLVQHTDRGRAICLTRSKPLPIQRPHRHPELVLTIRASTPRRRTGQGSPTGRSPP